MKNIFNKKQKVILGTFLVIILTIGFIFFDGFKKIEAKSVQFLASMIVKDCQTNMYWQQCYAKRLSDLNVYIPFRLTFHILNNVNGIDPQTEKCHLIVHQLAESEVSKNPDEWLSMFKYIPGSNPCYSGFMNGAIETKQRYDSKFKLTIDSVTQVCNQIKTITGNTNMYPCMHGMGQYFLYEENYDVTKAATRCSALQDGVRRYCLDGLFTEYIFKSHLISHGLASPIEENEQYARQIESVCKTFNGEKATSCWRELSIVYFKIVGPDFQKLKSYCERGILNENVESCYFRVISVAIMDKNFDKRQLSSMCNRFSSNLETLAFCYDWAITGIVYSNSKETHLVDDICRAAPVHFSNECWTMIKDRLKMYAP